MSSSKPFAAQSRQKAQDVRLHPHSDGDTGRLGGLCQHWYDATFKSGFVIILQIVFFMNYAAGIYPHTEKRLVQQKRLVPGV